MSNQLRASDCDYIQNALHDRLAYIRRVLSEGPLTASEEREVGYINALFLRLRNLEEQLNHNPNLLNN